MSRFAAVICEVIERSGRDTFNALKLEKKLSRQGIPVFATGEPIVIDGVNATTALVRRIKQAWLSGSSCSWKRYLEGTGRALPGRVEHRPAPEPYVKCANTRRRLTIEATIQL
jgi:hypothetical protein